MIKKGKPTRETATPISKNYLARCNEIGSVMRPVVELVNPTIMTHCLSWRLGPLASWRSISVLLTCLLIGPIGCETMTLVQDDFDAGVANLVDQVFNLGLTFLGKRHVERAGDPSLLVVFRFAGTY